MIVIKYPSTKDSRTDYHFLKRKDLNSDYFVRSITKMYFEKNPPIQTIEIETINRCNNDCSFCPVNRNDDTRPFLKMEEALFEKIINELADMDYRGYISIFSNNEPLIDVRIYSFIEYAKKKLPNAVHCLYTNGMLLDEEKYLKLTSNLDYLVIDNYNDDLKLLDNIAPIVEKYKDEESSCKVSILIRKKNQVLLNRGGEAPNRDKGDEFTSSCVLPFMQMIIRPDGKVSRCCQDALAKTTLGDVSGTSVKQVWESEEYNEFRKNLILKGRNSIDFCKNCDSFGVSNYFPEIWTHIVVQVMVEMAWEQKELGKRICVFEDTKGTRGIRRILKYHGLEVEEVLHKEDKIKLVQEDVFTFFDSNDYEILDDIDYEFDLLGKNYIAYEGVAHSLHTEFIDEDENEDTKEFIRFIDTIRNKRTIVFGTGFSALKINNVYHIDAEYYIDNNEKKNGTMFDGKKIWLPDKLSEENVDDICVVIASLRYNEMKKQLVDNGLCKEENIFEGLRYLD